MIGTFSKKGSWGLMECLGGARFTCTVEISPTVDYVVTTLIFKFGYQPRLWRGIGNQWKKQNGFEPILFLVVQMLGYIWLKSNSFCGRTFVDHFVWLSFFVQYATPPNMCFGQRDFVSTVFLGTCWSPSYDSHSYPRWWRWLPQKKEFHDIDSWITTYNREYVR